MAGVLFKHINVVEPAVAKDKVLLNHLNCPSPPLTWLVCSEMYYSLNSSILQLAPTYSDSEESSQPIFASSEIILISIN